MAGARIAETFKAADKNGDGKLSRDEYPQPRAFADVDANGDGFATLEEVRAYVARRRDRAKSNPSEIDQ
jgi:Ca2+-binding EF-hand superfamily protein